MTDNKRIILASKSPRRRELLEMLGVKFDAIADNSPEETDFSMPPYEVVKSLAIAKGRNVAATLEKETDALIISADTVVVADGKIMGKPKDRSDAYKMLETLGGRSSLVYTGVYVTDLKSGHEAEFYEKTEVFFKRLDTDEINAYINTGEPMDKAGAYGIQNFGALLIEKINGDYFTVVGLPLCRLGRVLKEEFDIKILG